MLINHENIFELSNEQLCVRYQSGDKEALEALVVNNEKLVHSRVNRFYKRYQNRHEKEDLYGYGVEGILEAANKFSPNHGTKFSTYCTIWIDQKIMRAIHDFGFLIRLPVHLFEQINYVLKMKYQYENYSEEALIHIIKQQRGWSVEKIMGLFQLQEERLTQASLNTMIGEESDSQLIDFIIDDMMLCPEAVVEQHALTNEIKSLLTRLNPKEQVVMTMRFGLSGQDPMTLDAVGKQLSLTRERVRQIEAKAIDKLRLPMYTRALLPFSSYENYDVDEMTQKIMMKRDLK